MGFSRQADEQANHRYKLINVTLAAYRGPRSPDEQENHRNRRHILHLPAHRLYRVEDYSAARCFSQAQAEARVSSTERVAFHPSSSLAREVSAQIATTSPGRRGANL